MFFKNYFTLIFQVTGGAIVLISTTILIIFSQDRTYNDPFNAVIIAYSWLGFAYGLLNFFLGMLLWFGAVNVSL